MSIEKYKKFRTTTAVLLLISVVVGIGIFFKNGSIIKANDNNGYGAIGTWILAGFVAFCLAVPFAEIGSLDADGANVTGLPSWSRKVVGKRFGYFVRFNYTFFYLGMLMVFISVFFSESLINIFVMVLDVHQPPIFVHLVVGASSLAIITTWNYFSFRGFLIVQRIVTLLKFVPLLIVGFLGIALVNVNAHPTQHFGHDLFGAAGGPFSFEGMMTAMPMAIFAFDSFLVVGTMSNQIDKPSSRLPIVVITGMVLVIALYLLVSVGLILHGVGLVAGTPLGPDKGYQGLVGQIFASEKVERILGITIMFFIAISIFGVLNGISAAFIQTVEQAINTNTFFLSKKTQGRLGHGRTLALFLCSIQAFWFIVIGAFALAKKSDAPIDIFSNFPTLIFLCIYAITIGGYLWNRALLKTIRINNILFYVTSICAIIGVTFVVGYSFFYNYLYDSLANPNELSPSGLFVGNPVPRYLETIIAIICVGIFSFAPWINSLLIKKFDNKQIPKKEDEKVVAEAK